MITKRVFGTLEDGTEVFIFTITNASGASASFIEYGTALQSVVVPDKSGNMTDVLLGYDTLREYMENNAFLGAICGRYANRIGGGRFTLNGKTYQLSLNDGVNTLHGGFKGFDKCFWDGRIEGESVCFSRVSQDTEEGYPGNLSVTVEYSFGDDNALHIKYTAYTDADTVLNLTSHGYFNLNGEGSGTMLGHCLIVNSKEFTENDSGCLPTGRFIETVGTPFDFTSEKPVGRDIEAENIQLHLAGGYDHNFVIEGEGMRQAAVLRGDRSGITVTVFSDQPGLQVYSGNFLTHRGGKGGKIYDRRDAICLETQNYPNATAYEHFPSPVLRVGETFCSETVYAFGTV